MSSLATLLAVILLLPLGGTVLLSLVGKRLGDPLSGYIGTLLSGLTFGAAVWAMVLWISQTSQYGYKIAPWVQTFGWLPVGVYPGQRTAGFLDGGLYVDSLTIVMMAMVTFVSAVVHLFSLGYMHGDQRYWRYFAKLSFFSFAMLGLVLSVSLVQMLIFWELVGLCSFLLIGFWYEKRANTRAAIKAFLVNRIGDMGFLIAIVLLTLHLGTTTLPDLWLTLAAEKSTLSPTLLTVIGVLLFAGAVGKSAQFPLHVWLPDAMAGPSPVSALIHAATMVAAGVFMLARVFPILTADTRLLIAIVGCATLLIGALCAMAQRDIKKVLAFSTISQLGYMVLAIGVGSWVGALFHLMTHAFFKALLFLSAGQVVHAMHHENRMEKFGGLWRRMPVTTIAFFVGVLAISGTPFLSGFYSKEMILSHLAAYVDLGRGHAMISALFWIPTIVAFVTPLYMMRAWMLTFMGKPRDAELFEGAGESGVMSFPLVLLCGMSVVAGYNWFPVKSMITVSMDETKLYFSQMVSTSSKIEFHGFDNTWPALQAPATDENEGADVTEIGRTPRELQVEAGITRVESVAGWAWLVGLMGGAILWSRGGMVAKQLQRVPGIKLVTNWLEHRMYVDSLYDHVFVGATMLCAGVASAIDRMLVDPIVNLTATISVGLSKMVGRFDDAAVDGTVRGVSDMVYRGGLTVASTQSGRVRWYVTSLFGLLAVAVATVVIVWLV